MLEAWREVPPTAGLPVIASDLRPGSEALEKILARQSNLPAAQIECSGTAALVIALLTLMSGRERRRKVVIPAYTCPLVALAIVHCGLRPVLCDLQFGSFNFDLGRLAQLCDAETLAVAPTHLGGRVADLAPVLDIAARAGAAVIEDAAHALGAMWHGKPVGSVGDIGFWSLAVGKGLTLYEGGVLLARDPDLRQRLRETSARVIPYRMLWELRRSIELLGYWAFYRPLGLRIAYGWPLKRSLRRADLVAAVGDDCPARIPLHRVGQWRKSVGSRALTRLPSFQQDLATRARRRKQAFTCLPGAAVIDDDEGCAGTWPFFMLLMPSERSRDAALASLWTRGLGVTRLFIHALPDYAYLARHFEPLPLPHARDFAARMLTVSNSPWLDDAGFDQVLSALSAAAAHG